MSTFKIKVDRVYSAQDDFGNKKYGVEWANKDGDKKSKDVADLATAKVLKDNEGKWVEIVCGEEQPWPVTAAKALPAGGAGSYRRGNEGKDPALMIAVVALQQAVATVAAETKPGSPAEDDRIARLATKNATLVTNCYLVAKAVIADPSSAKPAERPEEPAPETTPNEEEDIPF